MSIKQLTLFCTLIVFATGLLIARSHKNRRSWVIMLNPAGDTRHTGRKIADSFERGLTMQCAEAVKQQLEQSNPHCTVLLSRSPGDIVYDLQNASLANRLTVDLFISIHFYHTTQTKPTVHIYQFSYGDDFAQPIDELAWYSYDQAHRFYADITTSWIELFKSVLDETDYQKQFTVSDPYKLPFKPLIGIMAPGIGFEAGLKEKNDWQTYVEPISKAISTILQQTG